MHTNLFFELLQVALGTRERLSRVPSVLEWEEVYEEAGRQAVVGVLFNGIEKLQRLALNDERLADCMPPLELKLEWIGEVMQMEDEYRTHCERAAELTRHFKGVGVESCVLKGVGVAQYYPTPARRQCGDIDLWVRKGERLAVRGERLAGRDEGVEVSGEGFRKSLMKWLRSQYEIGHNVWHNVKVEIFDDVPVEIHFHPAWSFNPSYNSRLQKWFKDNGFPYDQETTGGYKVPSVTFNTVFTLSHTYRHFLIEGVTIKHVLDYYYIISNLPKDQYAKVRDTLHQVGLLRFAGAMMWVMKEVCGAADEMLLCEPNEKEGRFLLNEIISPDDGKKKLKKNSIKRMLVFVTHYPSEILWVLPWKVWHRGWMMINR